MVRGTTPGYLITVSGADLTNCRIFVTMAQGKHNVTLTGDRLTVTYSDTADVSSIAFDLTQQETLRFMSGKVQVQVRYADENGNVEATDIGDTMVYPVLNEDVI